MLKLKNIESARFKTNLTYDLDATNHKSLFLEGPNNETYHAFTLKSKWVFCD